MATSAQSIAPHPAGYKSAAFARTEHVLPALLAGVAGMVDVIGFLTLGLFTAHVTGNLVVIAALLVRGGPPKIAQILAVPVFMIGVAAVWLIARASGRRGQALIRPLLVVHFLLLAGVLVFSVTCNPLATRNGLIPGVEAMIAVAAMGCQFGLLRAAVPGAPSTAVMTGNLTSGVLALLDVAAGREPLLDGAPKRLTKAVELLVSFCAGCLIGALAVSLPVALAAIALLPAWSRP
jgi:uncharacterized membrane protein YoaK (UPF0700 family)